MAIWQIYHTIQLFLLLKEVPTPQICPKTSYFECRGHMLAIDSIFNLNTDSPVKLFNNFTGELVFRLSLLSIAYI